MLSVSFSCHVSRCKVEVFCVERYNLDFHGTWQDSIQVDNPLNETLGARYVLEYENFRILGGLIIAFTMYHIISPAGFGIAPCNQTHYYLISDKCSVGQIKTINNITVHLHFIYMYA